ncbi:MAG: hypothetical protein LW750_06255 [Bacteroidetes bacterium]|nr:hypothetical protein [Bacteroidota bacterium]
MKKLLMLFVALGSIGTTAYFFWHANQSIRAVQLINITETMLQTADTSRFDMQQVNIVRNSPSDSLVVLFPFDNSKVQPYMYDEFNFALISDYRSQVYPVNQPYSEMIRSITGKPNLNMSRLKEGVYYVHVTGCNYTGFFKIALKNSLQLTQ